MKAIGSILKRKGGQIWSVAPGDTMLQAITLMAERGVRHGKLNLIALEAEHHHAHDEHGEAHVHYRPAR